MSHCQKCHHELSLRDTTAGSCPKCGAEWSAEKDGDRWCSIARLTNLAEVGYVADLLEGRRIPTNIVQHNEFSALEGGWQTVFILQVSASHGDSAAEALRQELEDREHFAESREGDSDESQQRGDAAGVNWRPVMLALMAGGIAYCAGRGDFERIQIPRSSKDSLWRALSESDEPLVGDQGPDATRRFLRYDASSRILVLEEDFDRDGHTDRLRRFRDGRLVGEVEY